MALFNWIKKEYYDFRLKYADRLARDKDFEKATAIYQALLGKHPFAIVNYSQMLFTTSTSCALMSKNLKEIETLRKFQNESNQQSYQQVLQEFVAKVDAQSKACFISKDYQNAATLIDAISDYYVGDKQFCVRKNRYDAFLLFEKSQNTGAYEPKYKSLVQALIAYDSANDINTFVSVLCKEKRFKRIISLLLPFTKAGSDYEQKIIECTIAIIDGLDSEQKQVHALKDCCANKNINKKTAKKIWNLSKEAAQQSHYKRCVFLDKLSAEYLSDNVAFNLDRCVHLLEEIAPRYDVEEFRHLFGLANDLAIDESATRSLIDRVFEIATSANPTNAISLCSLFTNEERFRTLYIANALILAESKESILNIAELKSVIIANTDADGVVDALIPFVPFVLEFGDFFIDMAIEKIKRHTSTDMLVSYWKISPSPKFFKALVSDSYPATKLFANRFVEDSDLFIVNAEFASALGEAFTNLSDTEFALSSLETLVTKGVAIQKFYIQLVYDYVNEIVPSDKGKGLEVINHALTILPTESTFLNSKKSIIRLYIKSNSLDIALKEVNSISAVDEEAYTLLAEIHLAKAHIAKGNKTKKKELFEVIVLSKQHKLDPSFNKSLEETFKLLIATAEKLYEIDKMDAYDICHRIELYKDYWVQLYLKLRSLDYDNESTLLQKIAYQRETIDCIIAKVSDPATIHDALYIDVWESYIASIFDKSKAQPNEKAASSLKQLESDVHRYCPDAFQKYHLTISCHILQNLWTIATECEIAGEYSAALEQYSDMVNEIRSCDSLPLAWLSHDSKIHPKKDEKRAMLYLVKAECRTLICKLKAGLLVETDESVIVNSLSRDIDASVEEDLAYRFAYYLLEHIRPTEAEKIIKTYIPNEKELLDLCKDIFIRCAELNLKEFNDKLTLIQNGEMTSEDAKAFLAEIDSYYDKISVYLPDTKDKFATYKDLIDNYILHTYFNEEKYAEAYAYLRTTYRNFLKDDQSFRNVAIASLGMVENKTASDENIKFAISTWISAIFTDRLFVKSLDYTTWDNAYTFTLQGCLGSSDFDKLPDNVNYDDPIDNQIISIKEVQLSLLNRMETAIRNNYPQYESFFNDEKSALEALVDLNLGVKCPLVAPYISNTFKAYRNAIKNSFSTDLQHDYGNKEQILSLGVKYGFDDEVYTDYKKAMKIVFSCKEALQTLDATAISIAFHDISPILGYAELHSSLKSCVANAMSAAERGKMDYKKYFSLFYSVCLKMIDDSLSFTCAKYMNSEIVSRLNAETMKLQDGVNYLYKLYLLAPSNIQVKENLQGVLRNLAVECETKENQQDKSLLDSIIQRTGNTFLSAVTEGKMGGIINKFNNDKISSEDALEQTYSIYCKCSSNELVCRTLVDLCLRCIHEHIIRDTSVAPFVKNLLDKIANNKSAEFNKKSLAISEDFHKIWDQLPIESKLLISGSSSILTRNQSLNSNGIALQTGLRYMQKLAPQGTISITARDPYHFPMSTYPF